MKELLKSIPHVSLKDARNFVLLDTCFLANTLSNNKDLAKLKKISNLAMTSFNAEEFIHIERKLHHETRKAARKFLEENLITIIDVDVHPGDWKKEKSFVNSIEPKLLATIEDASDAVLAAVALITASSILTKDRHHLFTAALNNLSGNYKIKVCKELKDLT